METKQGQIGIVYRSATLGEIVGLREEVLIRGTDRTSPEFPGDEDPSTHHLAAFRKGRAIACLSLIETPHEKQPAFQLRGMAVKPVFQGLGYGKSLLAFTEKWVRRNSSIRLLWCNSRSSSVGFYEKQGWEVVSGEFMIEGVGPHVRMVRKLSL